jgi:peptide/nickel transport system permease protein
MTTTRLRVSAMRRRFGSRTALVVGSAMFATVVLLCIVVPLVSPYGTEELVAPPYEAPSWSHPFGTDSVGRDLFVRVFAAGRIDLLVAAVAIGFALLFGSAVGMLAGFARMRWIDSTLMRIVDAIIAFPFVVLILALVVLIGPDRTIGPAPAGLPATMFAFFIAGWAYYARLARSQTLALRQQDYILAAGLLGFSRWRIMRRHLAPSVLRVTAVYAVGDAILIIIVVASLAFLGAGVQPPTPEWGSIMFEGRGYLETAWWITVIPGMVVAVTGLALSLVADSLLAPERRR